MGVGEPKFITRISRLFKRPSKPNGDSTTMTEENPSDEHTTPDTTDLTETRQTLIRPWNRNNAVLNQVQEGFQSLTELMNAIRQGLEAQGARQEQLLQHLSALPKVLESIPESSRLHGETLKAMHDQMAGQADQQKVLGEILQKMSNSGGSQQELLEALRQRMDTLSEQDKAVVQSLNSVGTAMESASRNTATSTEVLTNLRENLKARDNDLERVLHRQGDKFTKTLSIAIFISIAALIAVVAMAWVVMKHDGVL